MMSFSLHSFVEVSLAVADGNASMRPLVMEGIANGLLERHPSAWPGLHLWATVFDFFNVPIELAAILTVSALTLGGETFEAGRFGETARLFSEMMLADDFEEFLTIPAYQRIAQAQTKFSNQ